MTASERRVCELSVFAPFGISPGGLPHPSPRGMDEPPDRHTDCPRETLWGRGGPRCSSHHRDARIHDNELTRHEQKVLLVQTGPYVT